MNVEPEAIQRGARLGAVTTSTPTYRSRSGGSLESHLFTGFKGGVSCYSLRVEGLRRRPARGPPEFINHIA